jgi:hypothetical protein
MVLYAQDMVLNRTGVNVWVWGLRRRGKSSLLQESMGLKTLMAELWDI